MVDLVLIDGVAHERNEATISVFDVGLQRGYGCFEVLHAYSGRLFRLEAHLDRLAHSANLLKITLPARADLASWAGRCAARGGDCLVRMIVTGGTEADEPGEQSRVIVNAEPVPDIPDGLALQLRGAPWHTHGEPAELAGAKSLSYGPNLAARLAARREGFDDAILITTDRIVLEGPMFSVGWIESGTLVTPSLKTGVLASITRGAIIEVAGQIGVPVLEGEFPVDRLLAAEEAFAMSTVREVAPIGRIDDQLFPDGPVTARLADGFTELLNAELGLG